MEYAAPLPTAIIERYKAWLDRRGPEHIARYSGAAVHQNPKAMIITCCDSRILISEVFGSTPGDFFIHRNIANLVPPYSPDAQAHGTSAAIEYAVIALQVEHIIVMGHHGCGGVRGCHDMLAGLAPHLDTPTSFVGSWLRILKPGFDGLSNRGLNYESRIRALEKEAVVISIGNLMSFPFVRERVEDGSLQLHGVWKDIREGTIEALDPDNKDFVTV